MAKKLNRSESVKENSLRPTHKSDSALKHQTKANLMQSKNHSQQFYEDMRRKKIEEIVNS